MIDFKRSNASLPVYRPGNILFSLFILLLFFGCAQSTVQIERKVTSKTYEEILFIPPKQDPRKIVPKVADRLREMGFVVHVAGPGKPLKSLQGSGFVVSRKGHILTCAHVLGDEKMATVWLGGQRFEADLIGSDKKKDLGLLKIRHGQEFTIKPLPLVENPDYRMGQDVYTIGFPLTSILGNRPRLSRGLISSTVGVMDNPLQLQVSAQVQPGNSGGPLLDENGVAIGVIQMTLNPRAVSLRTGGVIPQNVNFAIKGPVVSEFLKKQGIKPLSTSFSAAPGLDQAQHAVARIQAGTVPTDSENRKLMVVRFAYRSQWDLWYRFNGFRLVFFDYETRKPILTAGQQGNNTWTTEESVLEETFREIEKSFFPDRP